MASAAGPKELSAAFPHDPPKLGESRPGVAAVDHSPELGVLRGVLELELLTGLGLDRSTTYCVGGIGPVEICFIGVEREGVL